MLALQQQDLVTGRLTTTDMIVIASVIAATIIVTQFIRPVARAVLTRLARRSGQGGSHRWRVRTPRVFGETHEQAELRRRQRITATAAGLSRVASAVLWIVALLVILERAEIDPVLAISGAGFLGVAIAIGGQHSVNDFVTGMHILLEDRFGEGDKLRMKLGDEELTVTVAFLGAFATRLEDGTATFHVPNREMTTIANLSQRGTTTELEFEPSTEIKGDNQKANVEAAIRARYARANGYDGSRDGLVIDSVKDEGGAFTVRLRTARPLTDSQRDAMLRRTGEIPATKSE